MSESRVFKLSALLEAKVRDEGGRKLGKVHDVRVRRAGEGYEIEGLVVGKRGLLERLGVGSADSDAPATARDAIPWGDVVSVEIGCVTVRARS